ncbi:MAG TPA: hypothetical protein VF601_12250 [Beijerinckiaceae bacterium]|jgi:hypothetical protein
MTHDSGTHDPPPKGAPRHRPLDGIADPSDLMRQLSDLFVWAPGCRRRACRRAERCQGGEGPPCFDENRGFFAEAMTAGLRETRRFWKRQRALAREAEALAAPPGPALPPEGSGTPTRPGTSPRGGA